MQHKPFVVAFVLFFPFLLVAQRYEFDQYVGDEKVGTLVAEEHQQGDKRHINIRSHARVSVILSVEIDYDLEAVYNKDGILERATVHIRKNGKPHKSAVTKRIGSGYLVTVDGQERWLGNEVIRYSSALLYSSSPQNVSRIYSEANGVFNPVSQLKDSTYQLVNKTNGHENRYTYQHGQLTQVELDHWLAPVTIRRR